MEKTNQYIADIALCVPWYIPPQLPLVPLQRQAIIGEIVTKPPKLTVTQAKFVKAKVEGLSNTKAAMVATGTSSVNSAKTQGFRLSTNVNVQEAMQIALTKRNLTADRIAVVIDEAMDATKTVMVGVGEEAQPNEVPDHSIRLKAAGMAATYMGVTKTPSEGTTNNNFIQIVANQKDKYGL